MFNNNSRREPLGKGPPLSIFHKSGYRINRLIGFFGRYFFDSHVQRHEGRKIEKYKLKREHRLIQSRNKQVMKQRQSNDICVQGRAKALKNKPLGYYFNTLQWLVKNGVYFTTL